MNTGQAILVIAAFTLLSTLTLDVNARVISASNTGLEMESNLDALSVAQSMLDEILSKEFDEKTTNGVRAFTYDDITPLTALGTDGVNEVIAGFGGIDSSRSGNFQSKTKFDDIDDYNGYRRLAWDPRLGWFEVTVLVRYVYEDDPNSLATSPTFYKRITVSVSHPNLPKDNDDHVIPLVLEDLSVYRRYF